MKGKNKIGQSEKRRERKRERWGEREEKGEEREEKGRKREKRNKGERRERGRERRKGKEFQHEQLHWQVRQTSGLAAHSHGGIGSWVRRGRVNTTRTTSSHHSCFPHQWALTCLLQLPPPTKPASQHHSQGKHIWLSVSQQRRLMLCRQLSTSFPSYIHKWVYSESQGTAMWLQLCHGQCPLYSHWFVL